MCIFRVTNLITVRQELYEMFCVIITIIIITQVFIMQNIMLKTYKEVVSLSLCRPAVSDTYYKVNNVLLFLLFYNLALK